MRYVDPNYAPWKCIEMMLQVTRLFDFIPVDPSRTMLWEVHATSRGQASRKHAWPDSTVCCSLEEGGNGCSGLRLWLFALFMSWMQVSTPVRSTSGGSPVLLGSRGRG